MCTRSKGSGETTEPEMLLRLAMEELRQLREDRVLHQQRQDEFVTMLQTRDEELRELRERISQLSRSNNISTTNDLLPGTTHSGLGYRLKPDVFDGEVPLREFLSQFEFIANANGWSDSIKTVALAACLRGKARSVLDGIAEIGSVTFSELKSKLELRFGEGHSAQSYYFQFTNRRQKFGEDFVTLGTDLERLVRLAYPECSLEVREKIACAQFISALTDGFIKRTLQLEGVNSLKAAVERSVAIKVIQSNSFSRKNEGRLSEKNNFVRENINKGEEKGAREGKEFKKGNFRNSLGNSSKECWQCGAIGHFRFECPSLKNEEKGN